MNRQSNGYRKDVRSHAQFVSDIKLWHQREQEAARSFEQILSSALNQQVHIVPNGCDMSGEYLPDELVTSAPDFKIVFGTGEEQLLEIKATKEDVLFFHMKVDQILQYLKHYPDCLILMIRRWDPRFSNPEFTLFTPQIFQMFPFEIVRCHWWGGKLGYRCHVKMFRWESFVPQDNYPDDYLRRLWVKPEAIYAYRKNQKVFALGKGR